MKAGVLEYISTSNYREMPLKNLHMVALFDKYQLNHTVQSTMEVFSSHPPRLSSLHASPHLTLFTFDLSFTFLVFSCDLPCVWHGVPDVWRVARLNLYSSLILPWSWYYFYLFLSFSSKFLLFCFHSLFTCLFLLLSFLLLILPLCRRWWEVGSSARDW